MAAASKRMKLLNESIAKKVYSFEEAIAAFKSVPPVKFDETVEVAFNLGIDAKKESVRGAEVLPNGTGKSVKVAVFTQNGVAAAKDAGADYVGMEDLAEQFKAGTIQVDVVIASPDAMGVVGRLGTLLGPKGLMPNPKVGTVTPDVGKAVKNAKAGQVRFRADKNGIVHCGIGKLSFEASHLKQNVEVLAAALRRAKPSTAKGVYLKKLTVSTTMGLGLTVDLSSLQA